MEVGKKDNGKKGAGIEECRKKEEGAQELKRTCNSLK